MDAYLRALPSWGEFSPPKRDEDVPVGAPVREIEWDQTLVCEIKKYSITATPEDIVTYNPGSEILYLGSLIQGKTYAGGLGTIEELPIRQRAPLAVSIDLQIPDSSRLVQNPTLATVSEAVGDLVATAQAAGHKAGSSIYFAQADSQSLEQSMLKMGMSAKYMGAKVKSSLEADRTSQTHTLTAYFKQRMFTTSVVLPQIPASFFSPALTKEHLLEQERLGRIGSDNLPVFVSNIVWGRIMTLTMTSTRTAEAMKAALEASYRGLGVNVSGGIGVEHLETLEQSSIKLVTIGGDAQSALNYLRTGNLGEFFSQDSPLTTAYPLSYTLRNLGDNSIAKVSETTAYDIKECKAFVRSGNFGAFGDTIIDVSTGLQWEKKDHAGALHDVDNRYSWAGCCDANCGTGPPELRRFCQPSKQAADACASQTGGAFGCTTCSEHNYECNVDPFGQGVITTVWQWLVQVNAEGGSGFAGYSDWRLPSEDGCNQCYSGGSCPCGPSELESILRTIYPCSTNWDEPCIDPIFGPTSPFQHWSSTTGTGPYEWLSAFQVLFNTGEVRFSQKPYVGFVRAVRGGS